MTYLTYLFSFLTSATVGISFRAPRRAVFWIGLAGVLGWAGYDLGLRAGTPYPLAVFMGAMLLGTGAELMARTLKEPVIVFAIPGLFPLVPGLIAYNGMLLLAQNQMSAAAQYLLRSMVFAGALAAGLAVPPALFRRRRHTGSSGAQ